MLLAAAGLAFAQAMLLSGFFANRSAEDLAALERGEIISGKLSDWRKMSLGAAGPAARPSTSGSRP